MQIPESAIELRAYYTWMGNDGIVRTCVKPNVDISLEDAMGNTKAVTSLFTGRKFPLLIDSRQVKSMSYEARHHFSVRNRDSKACAFGIIIGSSVSRVLGNFYLGITRPSVPTRLFENEKEAVEWLKQFLEFENGN